MNGDPVSVELRQVLRDLKLSGVLDTLPERVELARQAHLPYPEFLTVILADEVTRRERVSTTVRARTARLDATMTLEGWDDSTEAVFDRDLWAELCTLRFVEARRDLIVMGPVGVGKTFMASALGHIACRRRYTTLAGRCDQILKRLRGSRLDGSHDLELRKLIRVEVLLIDDFCLQALDAADTADIYEVIVERHRRATTIVTTNREPPKAHRFERTCARRHLNAHRFRRAARRRRRRTEPPVGSSVGRRPSRSVPLPRCTSG